MAAPPINNVIGKRFIELLSVDSTNNYAMRQLQTGEAKGGDAYFAYEQTAGRGQFEKKWLTAKGENIILSVIIDTTAFDLKQQFLLNMITALSAQKLFNNYSAENAKIKWPNDIYWRDRKAAGILIENVIRGRIWQFAIVGIGMNINQTSFSSNLINPVSLKQITGKEYNVVELAKEFCSILNDKFNELMSFKKESILKNYNEELYKLNEVATFKNAGETFSAIIKSADAEGRLILEIDGEEKTFTSGNLEWIIQQ